MSESTPCINPATREIIGSSPLHEPGILSEMLKEARQAQQQWVHSPLKQRIRSILQIRKSIISQADELAEIISNDNGKTLVDALATELLTATMAITYYCKNTRRFLKPRRIKGRNPIFINKSSKRYLVPFGVVGIISPWNYPFAIPFNQIIMALLAGNAVLLKTASETQYTGLALARIIKSAPMPKHLFQFINLPGRVAGDALLKSGIDKLFFTGSISVGKSLMKKAAETLTPVCLELGGNDAMLVCEDADPLRAAAGVVWAGFQNAGQSCGAVERIYVHKDIYNEFMQALKEKTEALRIGPPNSLDTDMGCMTTTRQVQIVKEQVEDALEKGAKLFSRSKPLTNGTSPNFLTAMVLCNVNDNMRVMREETFGPVVGVVKVEDMEQALVLANNSTMGLTGSVWSKDRKRARQLANRIQAGVVTINDHLMSHGMPETSWGGFKQSGIGRTHGQAGFEEMCQIQFMIDESLSFTKKNLWWHPFSQKIYESLKGVMHMLYGPNLWRRLSGIAVVLKTFPRVFQK